MNGVELDELMKMRISLQSDIMNKFCNDSDEYGVGWKNRCVVVNRNEYNIIIHYIHWTMNDLNHNEENERIDYLLDEKYEFII